MNDKNLNDGLNDAKREPLLLYGAGDITARFIADYKHKGRHAERFTIAGIIDDYKTGELLGIPILGKKDILPELLDKGINNIALTILFDPSKRLDACYALEQMGYNFPSIINADLPQGIKIGKGVYIHEKAELLGYNMEIGDFSVIGAGVQTGVDVEFINKHNVIVKELTVVERSKIGKGVLISPGVVVGYDSEIGDATVMYPNSMCVPHTKIGKRCTINMGAIAHRIVPDDKTVGTYNWVRNQ
jgi:acetyltransferase-like isoleucine patch superfamily enzyme